VRLAYLVQPRLRRNGHSHDVEMRSGRHAVPLDIRGSGSFLYNLFPLNVLSSGVVIVQLTLPYNSQLTKMGLIIRTQQSNEFPENAENVIRLQPVLGDRRGIWWFTQ
jgi:hypothetical protein